MRHSKWMVIALLFLFGCASESAQLERAVEKNSSNPETLYKLGLAYRHEGRFLDSARTLDRASALMPAHPYALNEAGVSYALANRPDLAVDRFEKQIQLNDDPWSHSSLGSLYSDLFEYQRAESEIRKAIAGGLSFDGNFLLAKLRWEQVRTREARIALEAAKIADHPSSLIGGSPPSPVSGETVALLEDLIALDEAAERIAQATFAPPLEVPKSSLEVRVALRKAAGDGRVCRIQPKGDAWHVYDVMIATSSGRLEPPGDESGEEIVESIHTFMFRPIPRAAEKGSFYIRRFLRGRGRPPCWCAWNDCESRGKTVAPAPAVAPLLN